MAARRTAEGLGFQPQRRIWWRRGLVRWCAACFVALVLSLGATAHAGLQKRNVLIIAGRDSQQLAYEQFMVGFRSVIGSEGSPLELFTEFLDSARFPPPEGSNRMLRLLEDKYKAIPLDLVLALTPSALRFVLEHRDTLFPRVRVIFALVSKEELPPGPLPEDVIGILDRFDLAKTVAMARGLQPTARRAVIVSGVDALDTAWEGVAKNLAPALDGLEVSYLSGLPLPELRSQLARLPPDTIVLYLSMYRDRTGATYRPFEVAAPVATAATAPTYGLFPSYFGRGIVGGYMNSFEASGEQTATLVLHVLAGTKPDQLRADLSPPGTYLADSRQLRRWNLSESLLPPETIVKFREPTVWDRYRLEISIGVVLLLVQAGLIVALLIERRSRQRTATALEESQQQITLAARAAGLSSWIWDTAKDAVQAHPRSLRDLGPLQPATPFDDVVASAHPADRNDLKRAVSRAQRSGEDLDVEYRVVAPDGVRWIAARGRAEEQAPHRLLGIALDVTERKAAELRASDDRAALRHMTRVATMGQLSAAIAHQLNQPLAAILGNAEVARKMLDKEQPDLAELREICSDIVSEDHRATQVIRRLGELYRRGDLETEPLDLNELTRETLELLHSELVTRQVSAIADFTPGLPLIDGSHTQLQQVILNLILNAVEAMGSIEPDRRHLLLRTEIQGAEVKLLVMDTGPGIAPEHVKSLFDPFWSTKDGGMGMGLAICRSIVLAHRGTITAANGTERGATFCMSLPAQSPST